MKYKVVLQHSEEGFAASVPGLPGCHSQGLTEEDALSNIASAISEYLSVVAELSQGETIKNLNNMTHAHDWIAQVSDPHALILPGKRLRIEASTLIVSDS